MLVIRTWGEPLNELVDRVFSLPAGGATVEQAMQAIADANKQLGLDPTRPDQTVAPGTVISIPEVPGAEPRESVQPVQVAVAGALLENLRGAVPSLKDRFAAQTDDATARLDATIALLNNQGLQEAAAQDPAVRDALAAVQAAATARRERLVQLQQARITALDQATHAIGALLDLIGARTAV